MDSDSDSHQRQSKKPKTHDHDHHQDQSSTGFQDLPREIILDILSKLPITSLIRFKSVCQSWRDLLSSDRSLLSDLSLSAASQPCLIFHCDFPIRNRLHFADHFRSDQNDPSRRRVSAVIGKIQTPAFSPSMPEYDVVGSSKGLLCLSDSLYNDHSLVIFNPFTREFRHLPRSDAVFPNVEQVVFGFGFCRETGHCKVVKVTYFRNNRRRGSGERRVATSWAAVKSRCEVLTLCGNGNENRNGNGDATWQNVWSPWIPGPYSLHRASPGQHVTIEGKLHWVSRRYQTGRVIVSFDLTKERFDQITPPDGTGTRKSEYSLFTVRGCLGAAFELSNGKIEVWVMREYGVKESWEKEFVIGNYSPNLIKESVVGSQGLNVCRLKKKCVRVLGVLESGEVLLEYKEKSKALVVYDPNCERFKDVVVQGMPNYWYRTVFHEGSLSRIDSVLGML